jgi:hypothetical protein
MREADRNQQEDKDLKGDAFSERWRLAEDALNIAREVQRESGKLMSGRICLDDLTERRIERFLKTDAIYRDLVEGDPTFAKPSRNILERFEELVRRREVLIRVPQRDIYRVLVLNLYAESEALGLHPQKLVGATLLNSESLAAILKEPEFEAWTETPGAVRQAVVGNATDPRAALRKWEANTNAILMEPEFQAWTEMPGAVRRAVVSNAADPRAALRRWEADIDAILTEPEFEAWRETPSAVRRAAVCNSDARAALRAQ